MEHESRRTVSDLIDAFGGTSAFARIIGKGQSTAGEMKRGGTIRERYWAAVVAAARERGPDFDWVTSDTLMEMHARAREAAE